MYLEDRFMLAYEQIRSANGNGISFLVSEWALVNVEIHGVKSKTDLNVLKSQFKLCIIVICKSQAEFRKSIPQFSTCESKELMGQLNLLFQRTATYDAHTC